MYTQADGAWVKNAAEETRLVEAMRKGQDLTVKGTSAKGTASTDVYSLKGLPKPSIGSGRNAGSRYMTMTLEAAVIPGFVEKAPLERYVDPDRPSLVGKSRAELAAALAELACRKHNARCASSSSGIGSMSAASRASAR